MDSVVNIRYQLRDHIERPVGDLSYPLGDCAFIVSLSLL